MRGTSIQVVTPTKTAVAARNSAPRRSPRSDAGTVERAARQPSSGRILDKPLSLTEAAALLVLKKTVDTLYRDEAGDTDAESEK